MENPLAVQHAHLTDLKKTQMRMLCRSYRDGGGAKQDESQAVNIADITVARGLHQRLQTVLTGF